MCRGCRYDKCLEVGLSYEGPFRPLKMQQPTLLQRMITEYKALCDRRRALELELIRSHAHRRVPHPTEELYHVHVDSCYSIVYNSGSEIYTFCNNVFPALKRLGEDDQMTIFKDYSCKFGMFECYHRTRLLWGEQGVRFAMCSMVTCYDAESGFDGDTSKIENSGFLSSSFNAYAADQNAVFLPLFQRIELTEAETHALMALLLCDTDTHADLSDGALKLLDRHRAETLKDLQVYYREELGLIDFSRRLGNLMTLSHNIQECKSLFEVFFRFFATIFDTCITESMMKELMV